MTATFTDRLEHELLDAISRRRRRHRTRTRVATAGCAAVAALAAAMSGVGGRHTQALAITSTEDGTVVRIVDATADPDEMEEELSRAGIAADVHAVSVEKEWQGRWIFVGTDPPEKAEEILSRPMYPTLTIPDGTTYVYLELGRAPRDGETPTPLECLRLSPRDHAPGRLDPNAPPPTDETGQIHDGHPPGGNVPGCP